MKFKRWMALGLLAAMLGAACLYPGQGDKPRPLTYPEFWQLAKAGQVKQVVMGQGDAWQVTLADGTACQTPDPQAADGKERLLALGIAVTRKGGEAPAGLLSALLVIGAALLLFKGRDKGGALGLQKYAAVTADERIPPLRFSDVAIAKETLDSMKDLVAFLQEPSRFTRYGARMPKGVLLYGPPGTGKTLLAKALAGEAKAPFFAMSGADFVQVYVGVGASRVREVFRKARKAGGGVIFIDEIDAIGKKRDNGNDEREQTLNALLTEMSGYSGSEGILVLAATNRADSLDAALLREGRFDRRIEVGLPDLEQRLQILSVHARKKPLGKDVSLSLLARQTALFSGAQLEALLNEAAIRAARRKAAAIEASDVEAALCAVTVGEERARALSPQEKQVTAWHEAGHALVTRALIPKAQITRVTIIPSSRGAAGYAMSVQPDQVLHSRKEVLAMVCAALGGRMAEEMVFGPQGVTTGAESDLEKARQLIACMADAWAMGPGLGKEADEKALWQEAREMTQKCLSDHGKALEAMAKALLEKETLREEEVLALTEEVESGAA